MKTTITTLAATLALSGCVTPMMTPHPVSFTSSAPGTVIIYRDQRCTAPCILDIRDQFGFYSRYEIEATAGGKTKRIVIDEPRWVDAQGVVPADLHFDMGE